MAYKVPKYFKPVQKAAKRVLKVCPQGSSLKTKGLTKTCKNALRAVQKAMNEYYRKHENSRKSR